MNFNEIMKKLKDISKILKGRRLSLRINKNNKPQQTMIAAPIQR